MHISRQHLLKRYPGMNELTHLCSEQLKTLNILVEYLCKSIHRKRGGGMSVKTLPTYLLQIFSKIFPYSRVIVKSIVNPDNNFKRNSFANTKRC